MRKTDMGITSQVTRTVHVKPNMAMNEKRRCHFVNSDSLRPMLLPIASAS